MCFIKILTILFLFIPILASGNQKSDYKSSVDDLARPEPSWVQSQGHELSLSDGQK